MRGGVDALRARVAAGPTPVKAEAALRVVAPLLSASVADRTNWTLARLAGEVAKNEGVTISLSQLSKVLRKKGGIATGGHDTH
jgi:transposase